MLRTPPERLKPLMNTLYDSDSFAVVHLLPDAPAGVPAQEGKPVLARHGFEIVDKRAGKEVYLDGLWAELFQQHIAAWQENTPTQEEVEQAASSIYNAASSIWGAIQDAASQQNDAA